MHITVRSSLDFQNYYAEEGPRTLGRNVQTNKSAGVCECHCNQFAQREDVSENLYLPWHFHFMVFFHFLCANTLGFVSLFLNTAFAPAVHTDSIVNGVQWEGVVCDEGPLKIVEKQRLNETKMAGTVNGNIWGMCRDRQRVEKTPADQEGSNIEGNPAFRVVVVASS